MELIDAGTTLELDTESAGQTLDLIGWINMQLMLESGLSTNQTTVMPYTSTQISLIMTDPTAGCSADLLPTGSGARFELPSTSSLEGDTGAAVLLVEFEDDWLFVTTDPTGNWASC